MAFLGKIMHKSSSIEVTHQTHLVNFRYLAKNCLHKHFDFVHYLKQKMAQKTILNSFFFKKKDNSHVYATNNLNNNRDVVQIMGAGFFCK